MEKENEIVNENKLILDEFLSTASERDLRAILSFIKYLRITDSGEEEKELEIDEEEKKYRKLHTELDVQPILDSFNDLELSEIENKISFKLQKGNTSKEAFDTLKK